MVVYNFFPRQFFVSDGQQLTADISTENKTDLKAPKPDNNENNSIKISTPKKESEKVTENSNRDGKNLIKKEKAEIGNVRGAVYKHYMECIGYPLIFFTLAMYFIYQGFSIASNIWLGIWADDSDVYQNIAKRDLYLEVYGALGFVQGKINLYCC